MKAWAHHHQAARLQRGGEGALLSCSRGSHMQGPSFLRLLFGGLRGYRGNITPAAALDTAVREGNTVIVDIRSERDKGNSGVPDLPFGGRVLDCEYASIADRRLRGQLRNPGNIERQARPRAPATAPSPQKLHMLQFPPPMHALAHWPGHESTSHRTGPQQSLAGHREPPP